MHDMQLRIDFRRELDRTLQQSNNEGNQQEVQPYVTL